MHIKRQLQWGALLGSAWLGGCSSNTGGGTLPTGNSGSGNVGGSNAAGTTTTNVSSQGGSTVNAGATGGTSASNLTGGGSPATGGSSARATGGTPSNPGGGTPSAGGTSSTSSALATGGSAAPTCSNTDKTIIPIDKTGWVDKACDACGIQGAFYWYADANTKATLKCGGAACAANTPPYQSSAPGPGMCVSGTSTGSTKDWGAGIGFSLNDSGGTTSVKNLFDATQAACGNITGFDITLTGNTNGMPVRIGFTNTPDGTTVAPFIPAGDPAGTTLQLSGSSQIVIKNAAIPADWKSTDPSPASPSKLYDIQIQVATDQAVAGKAFNLCVTGIKPVIDGGSPTTTTSCKANSVGSISSNTGVQALGSSFGYQNNVNNLGSGSQSVTGYYGTNCAAISVSTSSISSNNTAPASYPSIVDGWHWGSWNGSYTKAGAKTLSALSTVTSSLAYTPPAGQKWDVAYDMWVASSTGIAAPDGNTLEVMVWLDYSTATTTNPIGSQVATKTFAGTSWEVWYGATGSWHTVSYRRTPSTAAVSSFDLLQFLRDAVTRGTGTTAWYLLSVQAGFELFNATSGGSIDSYSLTIN